MSVLNYDVLRTAKAALDEGLINQGDYDVVKSSFLRAQQIKAGLDAGFIPEAEFTNVKRAFLDSLNIGGTSSLTQPSSETGSEEHNAAVGKAPNKSSGGGPAEQHAPEAPSSRSREKASAANVMSADARAPALPSASSAAPPAKQAEPPLSRPAPAANIVRLGKTEVPKDIPNLGGRRPKQSQAVSMSGISVSEDAINMYYYLKAKSSYRWATWMINSDGNEVVIADVGTKDSSYADFLSVLPSADCRYGVYDYQFTNSEGCIFNKLVFLNWAPDAARIKAKMMYASTKDFFKGFLDGLSVELQGSDLGDITEQDVADTVRSTVTRQ